MSGLNKTDRELLQQALGALEKISMGGSPDWANDVIPAIRTRLAQPEHEWVGLTDEEIKNSMRGHNTQVEFARAIEAKLKEKNT
jgi:hypothetical protein